MTMTTWSSGGGRHIRWVIGVLLAIGLVVFLVQGANRPADPSLKPSSTVSTSVTVSP